MRAVKLSKKIGVVLSALVIAISANLAFFTPTLAANPPKWISRYTIAYNDDYFTDTNTFDTTFQYVASRPGDGGKCKSDQIQFYHGDNAYTLEEFYYQDKARGEATNGYLSQWHVITTGANAGQCTVTSTQVKLDSVDSRRITFVRSADNKTIKQIQNGATFTLMDNAAPTASDFAKHFGVYIGNDTESCKDAIVDNINDPESDDWFGAGQIAGSSMLFSANDNGAGARTSETLPLVLGGVPVGITCKNQDEQLAGPGSRYAVGTRSQKLAGAGWEQKNGGYSFIVNGDRGDDSYLIFIGTVADNTIPGTAPGTNPNPGGSPTGDAGSGGTPVQVCEDNVSGLGHILCPLLNGFDSIMKWLYSEVIIPFLSVPPITNIAGLRDVWNNVLVLANILFVLVFFVIIFSQATSIGISNYGVKSLLPKLIAVAVLVNISYYLCVFAVDISNILAAGITSLISVPLSNLPPIPDVNFDTHSSLLNIFSAAGGVALVGMAIAAQGGIIAAIAALAIPIVIATIATVLALILRLVLIVGGVAFSPIILIGFILPGTSRGAGRLVMGWLNLLWMTPIIYAMIALSTLGAYIIALVMQ